MFRIEFQNLEMPQLVLGSLHTWRSPVKQEKKRCIWFASSYQRDAETLNPITAEIPQYQDPQAPILEEEAATQNIC